MPQDQAVSTTETDCEQRVSDPPGFRCITVWSPMKERIETRRGSISYLHWCHEEQGRMARLGRAVEVLRLGDACAVACRVGDASATAAPATIAEQVAA